MSAALTLARLVTEPDLKQGSLYPGDVRRNLADSRQRRGGC